MFRFIKAISFLLFCSTAAHGGIVITGTRVIYPAQDKEVSVKISNKGKSPVLVQSWLDGGDISVKPDQIRLPFVLTPPINRIDPNNGQTLRIRALPNTFPKDRETVLWLNVLEIPARPENAGVNNYLQVAFRNRIKFFYRPKGLKGSASEAPQALRWVHTARGISVQNPTPYFVSLATVYAGNKKAEGKMVAPFSKDSYALPVSAGGKIKAEAVNDYGAVVTFESVVE